MCNIAKLLKPEVHMLGESWWPKCLYNGSSSSPEWPLAVAFRQGVIAMGEAYQEQVDGALKKH